METKQKIITAALRLIIENGYENTSLTEIAREIGITKPALYYHFQNKEELYLAVLDNFLQRVDQIIDQMTYTGNFMQALEALFYSLEDVISDFQTRFGINTRDPILKVFHLVYNAIKNHPDFRDKFYGIYGKSIVNLEKLIDKAQKEGEIRPDIDCHITAFKINALLEGTLIMSIFDLKMDLNEVGRKIYENLKIMLVK